MAIAGMRVSLNCEPMPATTNLLSNRLEKKVRSKVVGQKPGCSEDGPEAAMVEETAGSEDTTSENQEDIWRRIEKDNSGPHFGSVIRMYPMFSSAGRNDGLQRWSRKRF